MNPKQNKKQQSQKKQSKEPIGADLFSTGGGIDPQQAIILEKPPTSEADLLHGADVFLTGAKSPTISHENTEISTNWQKDELILGRFILLDMIGNGGMGEVWKATDTMLDEIVALKRLHPHLKHNQKALLRFEREVKLLQSFDYSGIVKIFDYFPKEKCFSMEWLQGLNLRQLLIQKERLSLQQTLSILVQICDIIEIAHSHQMVHRDLKPENIFLIGSQFYQVKLLDFGIAFILKGTNLTSHVGTIGTAYYMAPEQLYGQDELGTSADIFSLGVILYEMLVGRIPTGRARSIPEQFLHLKTKNVLSDHEQPIELKDYYRDWFERCDELYIQTAKEDPAERCSLQEIKITLQKMTNELIQAYKNASLKRFSRFFEIWQEQQDHEVIRQLQLASLSYPNTKSFQKLQKLFPPIKKKNTTQSSRHRSQIALQKFAKHTPAFYTNQLKLYRTFQPLHTITMVSLEDKNQFSQRLSYDKKGKYLTYSTEKLIYLWDMEEGCSSGSILSHNQENTSIAFHPKADEIYFISHDHNIHHWDLATRHLIEQYHYPEKISSLAISSSGDYIAIGDIKGTISIFDSSLSEMLHSFSKHSTKVTSLVFHPYEDILASASVDDESILLWSVDSGQLRDSLNGHTEGLTDIVFSSDGELLASASFDKSIQIWDTPSAHHKRMLIGHDQVVRSLSFDQENAILASSSDDGKIHLWDATTGLLFDTPIEIQAPIPSIVFANNALLIYAKQNHFECHFLGDSSRQLEWMDFLELQAEIKAPHYQTDSDQDIFDSLLKELEESPHSQEPEQPSILKELDYAQANEHQMALINREPLSSPLNNDMIENNPSFVVAPSSQLWKKPKRDIWNLERLDVVLLVIVGLFVFVGIQSLYSNSIGQLRKQLQSDSWSSKRRALWALGEKGEKAQVAILEMIDALKDDNQYVRWAAVFSLAKLGKIAIPHLTKLLKDENPVIRALAAETLGNMGKQAYETLPQIKSLIYDAHRYVVSSALWSISKIGGHDAVVILIKVLNMPKIRYIHIKRRAKNLQGDNDTNSWHQISPRYRLHRVTLDGIIVKMGSIAVPELINNLQDSSSSFQRKIIVILGKIGEQSATAVPTLLELLDGNSRSLQRSIIKTLGYIGPKAHKAIPKLQELTSSSSKVIRIASQNAIQRIQRK